MNTKALFCAFLTLPDVITSAGEYITRGGERVMVNAPSSRHEFGCRGTYPCGVRDSWHKSGRLYFSGVSANDIVRAA